MARPCRGARLAAAACACARARACASPRGPARALARRGTAWTQLLHLRRGVGRHVARAERALEVDLADRLAGRADARASAAAAPRRWRSAMSERGVACRRCSSSLSRLPIRSAGADLLLGLAQEVLLARARGRCRCPRGGSARTRAPSGRTALVAGLDVDRTAYWSAARVVVEVAAVDVHVDAADRVDRPAEAARSRR